MSPVRQLKKSAPRPRDTYEQSQWDMVVHALISQGRAATYAAAEADKVIAARRRQGAQS